MPDIGLFELLLIGLLLFLVVGPERMPEFFGQIARWVRNGRGWINQFRSELSRETAGITEPLKDARGKVEQGLDSLSLTAREVGEAVNISDKTPADRSGDKPRQD